MRAILPALVVLGACSSPSAVGPARFYNQPPVLVVNDRLDTPKPPANRPFYRTFYHLDSYYLRAMRALNLTRHRRAVGVNALDEVPDSTWFTNRVGAKALTVAEIRRGPGRLDTPDQHFPWTVKSAKRGGASVGFVVVDSVGTKFVLKFDERGQPEYETGADAIVSRLFWAAGYNVTSDHVVYFKRSDLKIAAGATYKDAGEKKPLTEAFLATKLELVNIGQDGSIRGLASLYVDGKPLGGMPRLGVRHDDPNDVLPHELRREQRGQAALGAWLAVTDAKEDQTIDTYVADPADPSRHYVLHYLIDFGKSLGVYPRVSGMLQADRMYQFDPKEWTLSLITLGLHRQPWEGRVIPDLPGVGIYSALDYDPEGWKPNPMAQFPIILTSDRFDQFWGAKLIARFTRAQIGAAVDSARFTDPRSAPYLVDAIFQRARITARHWFRRVQPIDEPTIAVEQGAYRLCFVDLAARYALEPDLASYRAHAYDREGRSLAAIGAATPRADAATRGRTCLSDLPMARDGDRYTIYEVSSSRNVPGTAIHVAIDPDSGSPRVIGVVRH